jgi:hypothetical protein
MTERSDIKMFIPSLTREKVEYIIKWGFSMNRIKIGNFEIPEPIIGPIEIRANLTLRDEDALMLANKYDHAVRKTLPEEQPDSEHDVIRALEKGVAIIHGLSVRKPSEEYLEYDIKVLVKSSDLKEICRERFANEPEIIGYGLPIVNIL